MPAYSTFRSRLQRALIDPVCHALDRHYLATIPSVTRWNTDAEAFLTSPAVSTLLCHPLSLLQHLRRLFGCTRLLCASHIRRLNELPPWYPLVSRKVSDPVFPAQADHVSDSSGMPRPVQLQKGLPATLAHPFKPSHHTVPTSGTRDSNNPSMAPTRQSRRALA